MPNPSVPVPFVNGHQFDFTSVKFDAANLRLEDIKAISYSEEIKPGKVRGTRAQLAGMTRGEYDVSGSVEIYKAALDAFLASLTSGGKGYLEQHFGGSVSYAEPMMPLTNDQLVGMRLTKIEDSHSEGGDPLTCKCDFIAFYLLRNGKRPLSNMRL